MTSPPHHSAPREEARTTSLAELDRALEELHQRGDAWVRTPLREFRATQHPLIRSFEPGEDWWHCYPDDAMFIVDDAPAAPSYPTADT